MESQWHPYKDGQEKEKFIFLEHQEELEDMTLEISKKCLDERKKLPKPKRKYVMLESQVQNNKEILKDKSKILETNSQTMKSSKMLDQVSTGKEKVLIPFWNKYTTKMSKKLWLPTKIDYVNLNLNLWSGSSKRLAQNSWYSVSQKINPQNIQQKNWQKTYSLLSQFLWQEITDCVQGKKEKNEKTELKKQIEREKKEKKRMEKKATKEPPIKKVKRETKVKNITCSACGAKGHMKTNKICLNYVKPEKKEKKSKPGQSIKIRLYPTTNQKEILRRWLGTARWTYNKCLDAVKNGIEIKEEALREVCTNLDNFKTENTWVGETPSNIREGAMRDLKKAYESNFAKKKKNPDHKFEIKYKSRRRMHQDSIVIKSKDWKKGIICPEFWKEGPMQSGEPLPDSLIYDSRLIRTKLGEYYLSIPKPLEIVPENQGPPKSEGKKIISLDPGVRKFCSGYDPSGFLVEWGKKDKFDKKIADLCFKYDKAQSRWMSKEINHKSKYKMKRNGLKIQRKIRNRINDHHHKFSKWLCENYQKI